VNRDFQFVVATILGCLLFLAPEAFALPVLADDPFETNDTAGTAYDLGTGEIWEMSLTLGPDVGDGDLTDFYIWTATADGSFTIDITFLHASANLNLILFSDEGITKLVSGNSATDNESVSWISSAGEDYWILVLPFIGIGNAEYDLHITGPATAAPTVPEPSAALLFLVGGAVLMKRRPR